METGQGWSQKTSAQCGTATLLDAGVVDCVLYSAANCCLYQTTRSTSHLPCCWHTRSLRPLRLRSGELTLLQDGPRVAESVAIVNTTSQQPVLPISASLLCPFGLATAQRRCRHDELLMRQRSHCAGRPPRRCARLLLVRYVSHNRCTRAAAAAHLRGHGSCRCPSATNSVGSCMSGIFTSKEGSTHVHRGIRRQNCCIQVTATCAHNVPAVSSVWRAEFKSLP